METNKTMLIHEDDVNTLQRLCELSLYLTNKHNLGSVTVEPKARPHPGGAFGICYYNERRVGILLRYRDNGRWWKNPLSLYDVAMTLAHELAHIRWHNHGREFKDFCKELEFEVGCLIRNEVKYIFNNNSRREKRL